MSKFTRISKLLALRAGCFCVRFTELKCFCSATAAEAWSPHYEFAQVENKWQQYWKSLQNEKIEENATDKKFYALSMFPYPSGALHMGHVRVYAISDSIAQFRRMQGYKVLHPMGWDAFGLPAENAALERHINPDEWTYSNINQMKTQLMNLGLHFNWKNEITTCSEKYYKWTQWLFLRLYDAGLAYQRQALVHWDPIDRTVLAKEQVDDLGRSWRSGSLVKMKFLNQWYLKLTQYADSLLSGLDKLKWPEIIKQLQRNWLGKKELLELEFPIEDNSLIKGYDKLMVYTDTPYLVYGVSYVAVAQDHPIVSVVMANNSRTIYSKDTDFSLGFNVINPFNGKRIPVYVAKYVLSDFGSVAVLGNPAHGGKREKSFSKKFSIPCYTILDNDHLVNSSQFTGMHITRATQAIAQYAKDMKFGRWRSLFKVSDWLVSRQRYWGTPIPIIHCPSCGAVPVPEKELPVRLPDCASVKTPNGLNLRNALEWINTECPRCGGSAQRDTDTMDTFVDSAWYYLRYLDPHNKLRPFEKSVADHSMPVDLYIGGIEHAIMHLLYARFICHFLHNYGYTSCKEPFAQLLAQGMVHGRTYKVSSSGKYLKECEVEFVDNRAIQKSTGEEVAVFWEKMSKSKHNGIDPQDVMKIYGADTIRLYVLFKAPPDKVVQWDTQAIIGVASWLNRIWKIMTNCITARKKVDGMMPSLLNENYGEFDKELRHATHCAIKRVTDSLERSFTFNSAIAELMKLSNVLRDTPACAVRDSEQYLESLGVLCLLLSPFCPHIASELWRGFCIASGVSESHVLNQSWPLYDELATRGELNDVQIIINGRRKGTITVPITLIDNDKALQEYITESSTGRQHLQGKIITRVFIANHGKLISYVTK